MISSLDVGTILLGLGGGLALFLYGMRKMTEALKTVAGARLKDVLALLTTNRFTGALSGALVTAVIQSSSVTTVMVVGFVSAGLLTFTQSVGVIMGANVGTTVTAQIVAFDIAEYSLVLIAAGFLVELLTKRESIRHYGMAVMGLGLLFFGMGLMSDATTPVQEHQPIMSFLQGLRNPIIGLIAGFAFTTIVQSSSATAGIVIVLATQGFITLETGIALILGSNVGTCVTAMLSAIGRPREAVKAAVVHVIFNLAGVLLIVAFIPMFADLVRAISPTASELSNTARLAAEVPRQIANAHTIFNIGCTVLFIGFAGSFALLADRIVPQTKTTKQKTKVSTYLDPLYLDQPAVALDRVRYELHRLVGLTHDMTRNALSLSLTGDAKLLARLKQQDETLDDVHAEIVMYLGSLSSSTLVEPLPDRLQEYFAVVNALESVGDTVSVGFVVLGEKRVSRDLHFHAETIDALEDLGKTATNTLDRATTSFMERDEEAALNVLNSRDEFDRLVSLTNEKILKPLSVNETDGVDEYRLAIALVAEIRQLHSSARQIARAYLNARRATR